MWLRSHLPLLAVFPKKQAEFRVKLFSIGLNNPKKLPEYI
jgi:hypothetical protein